MEDGEAPKRDRLILVLSFCASVEFCEAKVSSLGIASMERELMSDSCNLLVLSEAILEEMAWMSSAE